MFEYEKLERGATSSEYAMLLAIVTVALLAAVGALSLAITGSVDGATALINN